MSVFVKVSNVSSLVTEDNLRELFQCCGGLKNMNIGIEEGKRIGCIEFEESHHADTALMLNGTELGDTALLVKTISAELAQPLLNKPVNKKQDDNLTEYERACKVMEEMMKGPNDNNDTRANEVKRTVYVGNLSKNVTPAMLREEFESIGEVVYIKFSARWQLTKFVPEDFGGNADFRYAFIEFATEEQARMAFSLHGKVLEGQAIKVGIAHNPIFKDDHLNAAKDNPMYSAKEAAKKLDGRYGDGGDASNRDRRSRRRSRSGDRSRGRRRRRRRSKRKRSRSRSRSAEKDDSQPKMFWDGYQWHFNDTKNEDIEEHVTSIIRSDIDAREPEVDTQQKMQNAAQEALKALQVAKGFGSY